MRAESYGWDRPNPKIRVMVPGRPLYVHKAQGGGIWVGESFVPRGHAVPAELLAELGAERVKLMHFVRELDHAPIEGVTPSVPAEPVDSAPIHRKHRR